MTEAAVPSLAPAPASAPSLTVYRDAPSYQGLRTAGLGQFRCPDAASGAALIAETVSALRAEGFEAVIGPMDGDTWHSYRLVTESDGSPPFLMEPVNPPFHVEAFARAGFAPVSTYVSARAPLDGAASDPAAGSAVTDDVTVAPWNGADVERFMADVFALSSEAFAQNPFYKPLSRDGFDALYRPMLGRIDPRLMLFAHDRDGALLGFVFGLPDLLSPASRTAILKTYASRRRGVGRLLAEAFHRAAREAGFVQVIHALMHEENVSRDRSGLHGGAVFRRYALFGRVLA